MNDFTKDFDQALFNPDKINDLLRKELQQAVNNLLEAELTTFLGYDPYARNGWNTGNSRNGAYFRKVDTQFGPIEVQVPRDRNGQFHQHTLPDYKRHSDILESMIIKLYSKGVTTREIADLSEKMYGSHYSPAQVSNISKQMFPKVEAYHKRKLSDKFFCVYLDATYLPLRRETFEREAVYIAIGIKPNGHKEVIDYCIALSENIEVWTEMLQNMRFRGLMEIESDLLVFYNYPKQIRASIYSTNMIESFNNVIKRKAKPKAEFPTEQSLDAFIGIQAMSYNDRYFDRIHKGFGQVQDTLESYFD